MTYKSKLWAFKQFTSVTQKHFLVDFFKKSVGLLGRSTLPTLIKRCCRFVGILLMFILGINCFNSFVKLIECSYTNI